MAISYRFRRWVGVSLARSSNDSRYRDRELETNVRANLVVTIKSYKRDLATGIERGAENVPSRAVDQAS